MTTTPIMPEDIEGDGRWLSQHSRFVNQMKEKEAEVVFIGDSIIQMFQFSESWKQYIEPLHCLNFGIAGDTTQNLLWRIKNNTLDGCNPKVIVIGVGSENQRDSAQDITEGIIAVVNSAAATQPDAQIIVMGLLPCGHMPNPKRDKHEAVNKLLAERLKVDNPSVIFLQHDWDQFIEQNGAINYSHMHDYLIPTKHGYAKLLDPLLEELQNCLHTFMGANEAQS